MRQHVEPQVGGADRIGLLDHELPPHIEPGRGSRERERDEETQQAEHRAIDRPDARPRALGITRQAPLSDASPISWRITMPMKTPRASRPARSA
jgi:hypothetical protein